MKEVKVISIHKKDCNSVYRSVNGKVVGKKVTKAGWAMYVEITTLKNGKKVSVTRHGPKP
jgi:hypothetical protein